ncbi:hypothetical protein ACGFX2_08430 [Streptomyces goshikiensis]|uniref:hypothetical protein n=1 Tax=Streptomyces goshikiensis TaxID=1942 RepID=UPI0037216B13
MIPPVPGVPGDRAAGAEPMRISQLFVKPAARPAVAAVARGLPALESARTSPRPAPPCPTGGAPAPLRPAIPAAADDTGDTRDRGTAATPLGLVESMLRPGTGGGR